MTASYLQIYDSNVQQNGANGVDVMDGITINFVFYVCLFFFLFFTVDVAINVDVEFVMRTDKIWLLTNQHMKTT